MKQKTWAMVVMVGAFMWSAEADAGIIGRGILKYGNHCGPGHENPNKRAVDAVDAMCKQHDRCCRGKQLHRRGLVYCPCRCDRALLSTARRLKGKKLRRRARLVLAGIYRIFRLHRCICSRRRACRHQKLCRRIRSCRFKRVRKCKHKLVCRKSKKCKTLFGKRRCIAVPKCKRVKRCAWRRQRRCHTKKRCRTRRICRYERPIKGRSGRCR